MRMQGFRPSRVVLCVWVFFASLSFGVLEASAKSKTKFYPIEDAVFQVAPSLDGVDLEDEEGLLAGATLLSVLDKERVPAQVVVSGRYRKGNKWRQVHRAPLQKILIYGVVRPLDLFEEEELLEVSEQVDCGYADANCALKNFVLQLNGQGVDLGASIILTQGGLLLGRMMTWVQNLDLKQPFEMAGLSADWVEPKCPKNNRDPEEECQPGIFGKLDQR